MEHLSVMLEREPAEWYSFYCSAVKFPHGNAPGKRKPLLRTGGDPTEGCRAFVSILEQLLREPPEQVFASPGHRQMAIGLISRFLPWYQAFLFVGRTEEGSVDFVFSGDPAWKAYLSAEMWLALDREALYSVRLPQEEVVPGIRAVKRHIQRKAG